jgi:hypothetical protein
MTDRPAHPARISEHTPMDVLDRVLRETGDDLDRVLIIAQDRDGIGSQIFSNARSEAEMFGMAWRMMNHWEDISED